MRVNFKLQINQCSDPSVSELGFRSRIKYVSPENEKRVNHHHQKQKKNMGIQAVWSKRAVSESKCISSSGFHSKGLIIPGFIKKKTYFNLKIHSRFELSVNWI